MPQEEISLKLAQNLQDLCKARGITISSLSRLSGVKQPTLHGWLTGRSVQKMEDLRKICDVFKISLHEMLFGIPDPNEIESNLMNQSFLGEIHITIKKVQNII